MDVDADSTLHQAFIDPGTPPNSESWSMEARTIGTDDATLTSPPNSPRHTRLIASSVSVSAASLFNMINTVTCIADAAPAPNIAPSHTQRAACQRCSWGRHPPCSDGHHRTPDYPCNGSPVTVNHDFEDDDVPSVTLDQMVPNDLTLMNLDQKGLDALRNAEASSVAQA
jgi:hypothetical protein